MNQGKIPELKEVLGAMILASSHAITVSEMRKCLVETAKEDGGDAKCYEKVRTSDITRALAELREQVEKTKPGFALVEVAGGFRFQSLPDCGIWMRRLLKVGRPRRLSVPALETLAIIAYRQPVSRVHIEGVRGVNVDHMVKTLLEMQLIRIVGRSDLPGHPFLYGTTQLFLEHFGLKDLSELKQIEPLAALNPLRDDDKPDAGQDEPEDVFEEEDLEDDEEEDDEDGV